MAPTLADDLFALAMAAQHQNRAKERQEAEHILDVEYPEWTMEIVSTLKENALKGELHCSYTVDPNRGVDGQVHACAAMKVFEYSYGLYVTPLMDGSGDWDSPTIVSLMFSWDKSKPRPTSIPGS